METTKRINSTLSKVCLLGAGIFSFGTVSVQAANSTFLTNSATGLSQLMADRLACPVTPSGEAGVSTLFWHARESLRNDFLENCTINLSSSEDLVSSSHKKNTSNVAALIAQAEKDFIERYEQRSGKSASAAVKKFAAVAAEAIADSRVHARRMGRKNYRCTESDATVTAIASRLKRVFDAAYADSKNLVAGNDCGSMQSAGWTPWTDKSYASNGQLSNLAALNGVAAPATPAPVVAAPEPEPAPVVVAPEPESEPEVAQPASQGEDKETFAAQKSGGSTVRFKGGTNLNGFREPMVRWNECGDNDSILSGAYINDYSSEKSAASYPSSSKLASCTDRKISEAFFNFLNKNFKRCVAISTLPAAQKEISNTIWNASSRTDVSGLDNKLNAAIGRIEDAHSSSIQNAENSIQSIKIFHNGVQGDSRHSNRSYHAATVLRAIDISYIVTKDTSGKQKVWQHNVGSYADRVSSPNAEQAEQVAFWRTFSACMTEAGGATITKVLYSTGTSYNHKGHVHLSLPYRNRGSYYSRDYEPGPIFNEVQ